MPLIRASVLVVGQIRRQSHDRVDEGENDSRCYTFQSLREIRRPPSNYRETHECRDNRSRMVVIRQARAYGLVADYITTNGTVRKRKPEISAVSLDACVACGM